MALRQASAIDLPSSVRGWSAALSALDPAIVRAFAPLLQRLDELVARHVAVEGRDGEPEGYGGLTTRGTPDRILASEWALADAAPEEFLRRAVSRELLHVEQAFRHDPPGGTTRVVVDTGPAQAGAARLVQLAALVVLHRRAVARGATVEIGVLGTPAGQWLTGELPELLAAWLVSRKTVDAGPEAVQEWHDADPEAWFVVRPKLVERVPGDSRPVGRLLTAQEGAWSDVGVVGVEVALGGERVQLPVPPAPEALRVLRGEGFRRDPGPGRRPAVRPGEHVIRDAVLTSAGRSLLGRGSDPSELVVARIVPDGAKATARVRRLPGPVLAAGATGRRLVVLHAVAGGAVVSVLGKHLGRWDDTFIEGSALHLADTEQDPAAVLSPMHHHQGELWVGWPSAWRLLSRTGEVSVVPRAVAVVPRSGGDVVVAVRGGDGTVGAVGYSAVAAPTGALVVGGGGWLGVQTADERWRLLHTHLGSAEVDVPPAARVAGLVVLGGAPHLVTISAGALVLRLVRPGAQPRTLTALSGAHQRIAVHQVEPWLARDLGEGEIELHDLDGGVRIATFPGNLA